MRIRTSSSVNEGVASASCQWSVRILGQSLGERALHRTQETGRLLLDSRPAAN
jgi:hypothetical protein